LPNTPPFLQHPSSDTSQAIRALTFYTLLQQEQLHVLSSCQLHQICTEEIYAQGTNCTDETPAFEDNPLTEGEEG